MRYEGNTFQREPYGYRIRNTRTVHLWGATSSREVWATWPSAIAGSTTAGGLSWMRSPIRSASWSASTMDSGLIYTASLSYHMGPLPGARDGPSSDFA